MLREGSCGRCVMVDEIVNYFFFKCFYARLVQAIFFIYVFFGGEMLDFFYFNVYQLINLNYEYLKEEVYDFLVFGFYGEFGRIEMSFV